MALLTRRYNLSLVHLIPEDYVDENGSRLQGHDFKVEVTMRGELQSETGEIINREHLDILIREVLIRKFDKTLINEYFKYGTGECIAAEFLQRLRSTEIGEKFVAVQLVETRKN